MADATAAATPILNAPLHPIAWVKTLELSYSAPTTTTTATPEFVAVCFHCGRTTQQLLKCGKCKVACYCQKECQVTNWKNHHKSECELYARVGVNMHILLPENQRDARNEIFGRIRFYACPYAIHKQLALGRGFLFVQSDRTLALMSLPRPIDCCGHPVTGVRFVVVHYLTLGEYDQEVCRDDFEMTEMRTELQQAVADYDEETEVVILMRFRCGHVALGTAPLVPAYNLCKQLGRDYFAETNAGALQLNLDDV